MSKSTRMSHSGLDWLVFKEKSLFSPFLLAQSHPGTAQKDQICPQVLPPEATCIEGPLQWYRKGKCCLNCSWTMCQHAPNLYFLYHMPWKLLETKWHMCEYIQLILDRIWMNDSICQIIPIHLCSSIASYMLPVPSGGRKGFLPVFKVLNWMDECF